MQFFMLFNPNYHLGPPSSITSRVSRDNQPEFSKRHPETTDHQLESFQVDIVKPPVEVKPPPIYFEKSSPSSNYAAADTTEQHRSQKIFFYKSKLKGRWYLVEFYPFTGQMAQEWLGGKAKYRHQPPRTKLWIVSGLNSSLDHATQPQYLPRRMARRRGSPARTTGPSTPPWARLSRRPGSTRWRPLWRSPRSSARVLRSQSDHLASRKHQLRCLRSWESELLLGRCACIWPAKRSACIQKKSSLQALTIPTLYEWVVCSDTAPSQNTFSARQTEWERSDDECSKKFPLQNFHSKKFLLQKISTPKKFQQVPLCQSPLFPIRLLSLMFKKDSFSKAWEILVKLILIKFAPKKFKIEEEGLERTLQQVGHSYSNEHKLWKILTNTEIEDGLP